jgi:hypothetical protein
MTRLLNWLSYSNRDEHPYNPTLNTEIITDVFWSENKHERDSLDWQKEEWLIRSALVPIDQINNLHRFIPPLHLHFEDQIGWNGDGHFNFAQKTFDQVDLYPWVFTFRNPINRKLIVKPHQDFFIYHCLDENAKIKYYHPLDNIAIIETNIDSHDFYESSPNVKVHRNYLRDYLAAKKMALLISVVSDRFANTETVEQLGFEDNQNKQIDKYTSWEITISPPEYTNNGYFMSRATLYRSFIIKPFPFPKVDRTPWYYYGTTPEDNLQLPHFILDEEGQRSTLDGYQNTILDSTKRPSYLYFRPEVLRKYLQTPEYSVFFHMRNWGLASLPGNKETIDVGINSEGLVTAFAYDIADLNVSEQSYWASYSSLPSGEICEELFETRMQSNPPHSPGITAVIENARSYLNQIFSRKYSSELFKDKQPSQQDYRKLSVGALSKDFSEVCDLAKILYGWVIETMEITPLKNALGGKTEKNKDWKQITLLKEILVVKGIKDEQARTITDPLRGLNELRIAAAHIGGPEFEKSFQKMGKNKIPETPRKAFNYCVDSVAQCLIDIANKIEEI